MSLIKANSHCASYGPDRIAMLQGQGYTVAQCEAACRANSACHMFALFDQHNGHSAPYFGRCDIYTKCSTWMPWSGLQNYALGTGQYGQTYVQNYQAAGTTNFNNSADKGNTQVDNLSGLAGSVQNFGLMNLAAPSADDLKKKIDGLEKQRKALDDKRNADLDKLGANPTMDGLTAIEDIEKKMDAMKTLIAKFKKQLAALKPETPAEKKEDSWMCKDDDTKFCRKLTEDEGKCYWINQPKQAGQFASSKLELNTENASFAWNFAANAKPSVLGKVECKEFPSTMQKKKPSAAEALKAAMEAAKKKDADAKKDPAAAAADMAKKAQADAKKKADDAQKKAMDQAKKAQAGA